MPINKNAYVRYQALDRCLSNKLRRYYINDLIEACCKALSHVNGDWGSKGAEGVSRRQVFNDMNAMEIIYGVIIKKVGDGHKKYYTYENYSKTLRDSSLQQGEIDMVSDALIVLKRFDGVPQLDWLYDLENKLYTTSKLGKDTPKVVSFQHNQYLRGLNEWYKPAFNAIVDKRTIEIIYHPFGKDRRASIVSPYHLKQYNNRWFLIGKCAGYDNLSNFAIDRIEGIRETAKPYEPLPEDFDFEEFYSDVVGVSVTPEAPVHDVVLHVTTDALHYIMTKPLHESQRVMKEPLPDGQYEIHLNVQDNYELRSLLLSRGDEIEVVSPQCIRDEMRQIVENLYKTYQSKDN